MKKLVVEWRRLAFGTIFELGNEVKKTRVVSPVFNLLSLVCFKISLLEPRRELKIRC